MSSVVVYVFLLDNLAGFNNALNETLMTNTPNLHKNSTMGPIQKCDIGTTQQILKAVSRELEMEIIPSFKTIEKYPLINKEEETLLDNELVEESLPEADGKDDHFQKPMDSYENYSNQLYGQNFDEPAIETKITLESSTESKDNVSEAVVNTTKMELPKMASFLVAIFETLSNTTAQTCAGTLIAPRWVLTASNCINILSNFYANNTNDTDHQSLYTVVAGATDPLSDGSVHNVTSVLMHQGYWNSSSRYRKSVHVDIGPYLAMLEIEPEFEGAGLELVEEKVMKGHVMIYGWVMIKEETGLEYLKLMTMSALILSSAECQAMYNYNNNDVICLFNNEKDRNITQLSSGGPVLMQQGDEMRMLAVVQTDEHVYIAYPLHVHYHSIKKILENKI